MKTKELYAPEDQELFENALVAPYRNYLQMKISLNRDLHSYQEVIKQLLTNLLADHR